MILHRLSDFGDIQSDCTFRTPPSRMLVLPVILLLICIGLAWGILQFNAPFIFWGFVALFGLFVPLIFLDELFADATTNKLGD